MALKNRNFKRVPDIVIADAKLTGRPNFSGAERKNPQNGSVVNSEGNRNFCIDIPADGVMINDGSNTWMTVEELIDLGWPIKIHGGGREDGSEPSYYLPVKIGYKYRPPLVYLVVGNNRYEIGESEIDTFDGRQFSKVNLIVHPSVRPNYDTGENSITAYLAEGWFHMILSPFQQEWDDMQAAVNDETPF